MNKNPLQNPVQVVKRNVSGWEVWRYPGTVLKQSAGVILLEAFFNRDDLPFCDIIFRRGDRFLEAYFTNRWYNIFEVYDVADAHLKCWYCNITKPAVFKWDSIFYVDLALDLLVYPSGERLLLDEEEFLALPLDDRTRTKARSALAELESIFCSVNNFRLETWLEL